MKIRPDILELLYADRWMDWQTGMLKQIGAIFAIITKPSANWCGLRGFHAHKHPHFQKHTDFYKKKCQDIPAGLSSWGLGHGLFSSVSCPIHQSRQCHIRSTFPTVVWTQGLLPDPLLAVLAVLYSAETLAQSGEFVIQGPWTSVTYESEHMTRFMSSLKF